MQVAKCPVCGRLKPIGHPHTQDELAGYIAARCAAEDVRLGRTKGATLADVRSEVA